MKKPSRVGDERHAHFPRCENWEIVVKAPWKKDGFFQHVDYLGLENTTEKRQCLFDILKGMFEIREASAMRLNRDAIGNRLQSQPATGREHTMDRGSRGTIMMIAAGIVMQSATDCNRSQQLAANTRWIVEHVNDSGLRQKRRDNIPWRCCREMIFSALLGLIRDFILAFK